MVRAGQSPLTVPENTGLVCEVRCGAGPLATDLDPGLNQRLVHPGSDAQLGDLPVPRGVELVLAISEGQACAFGQQGNPPGGDQLQSCDRDGFLVGCQPTAGSEMSRRSRGLCDEETIGGDAAHKHQTRTRIRQNASSNKQVSNVTSHTGH